MRWLEFQTTSFEDDTFVSIVVDSNLSVGRVSSVNISVILSLGLIAQSPAVADDAVRVFNDSQAPSGDIGLVRTLVARIAVAVETLPMPVIMKSDPRDLGVSKLRWAAPPIEIEVLGRRIIANRAD